MDDYPKYGIRYRLTEKSGREFRNFMQKGLDGDFANRQQSLRSVEHAKHGKPCTGHTFAEHRRTRRIRLGRRLTSLPDGRTIKIAGRRPSYAIGNITIQFEPGSDDIHIPEGAVPGVVES